MLCGAVECNRLYEKVIKVKADVAAYLISFHLHTPPVVTWGAVKGAPEQGAFILTLDSSPRHLQSSWERSATQFSWASFLSRFGFQFVLARLPRCFRTVCLYHSRSFTEVR